MRLALLLVLLAACDKLFSLQPIKEHSTDGAVADTSRDSVMVDMPTDGIAQTHSNCPANFGAQLNGGSKYQYIAAGASWYSAMQVCKALDDPTSTKRVHLAVLSDDQERSHVWVNVVGSATAFWIGLSDTKIEGIYQWVTNDQVNYPGPGDMGPWDPGEPTPGTTSNCVLVKYLSTALDSISCFTSAPYVCECDDHADDPTHYTIM